jgi:hypothetical protein
MIHENGLVVLRSPPMEDGSGERGAESMTMTSLDPPPDYQMSEVEWSTPLSSAVGGAFRTGAGTDESRHRSASPDAGVGA